MFVAKDSKENRIDISEAEKGKNYYCRICNQLLVIHRGQFRTEHFAHYNPRGKGSYTPCSDKWKYDMSDWHYEWQSIFSKEYREVIVEADSKKHIADVLINGIVVEFQHSRSILPSEFNERNTFYTQAGYRVIWVFDLAEEFASDDISNIDKVNQYAWSSPWTVFRKLNISNLKNTTIYFQFSNLTNPTDDYPLEMVTHAYSNFKTFYTNIHHALSIHQFVDMVKSGDERLFYKPQKHEETIHRVEGGKSICKLWQNNYTGIMVQNLVNHSVMAINGSKGEMWRNSDNKVVGYYVRQDLFSGLYKVNKKRKYIVWQAEDDIWELLKAFAASKEEIDKWEKDRIEKEKKTREDEEKRRQAWQINSRYFEEKLKQAFSQNTPYKGSSVIYDNSNQDDKNKKKEYEEDSKKRDFEHFKEILVSLLENHSEKVVDPYGKRWLKCDCCGLVATEDEFVIYGGKSQTIGTCRNCSRNGNVHNSLLQNNKELKEDSHPSFNISTCPRCGRKLVEKNGKYGKFIGCSGYPNCKYSRKTL